MNFSGLLEEASEGTTGALTKIGTATLMLTNANTYMGGTTIEGGKLVINNKTGPGAGSGAVQVNAGVLSGRGTIAGSARLAQAAVLAQLWAREGAEANQIS